jgi:hypothetical protein
MEKPTSAARTWSGKISAANVSIICNLLPSSSSASKGEFTSQDTFVSIIILLVEEAELQRIYRSLKFLTLKNFI